jgi:hydrogenase expression/formation protein HypE
MGAKPIGISLAMVLEEGFPKDALRKLIFSIQKISKKTKIPVVTGDTKVSQRGKLDKIEITTAGVGLTQKIIDNRGLKPGDKVISSGKFGEHGAVILAERFNYKTKIKSDSRPIFQEIQSILKYLTSAKDPTRGGLAANLNELAEKGKVKIILEDKQLLFKKEILALTGLLGIDPFILPSEGRFIATVKRDFAQRAVQTLKKFNKEAAIIGEIKKGRGVFLKTKIGSLRPISMPEGRLIPRIC